MTWSYFGLPGTDSTQAQADAIRLLAGQHSSGDVELVQDEELSFFLSEGGGIYGAAALMCETLAGRYGGRAKAKTVGDLSLTYEARGTEFRERARALRAEMGKRSTPFAGGISIANKSVYSGDTDRVQGNFRVGMDDAPATTRFSTGANG